MLSFLLSIAGWPGVLLGGGAIVALLLTIYLRVRASGAAVERARREAIDRKAAAVRDDVEDAVAGRTADENRKRLQPWAR